MRDPPFAAPVARPTWNVPISGTLRSRNRPAYFAVILDEYELHVVPSTGLDPWARCSARSFHVPFFVSFTEALYFVVPAGIPVLETLTVNESVCTLVVPL